MNGAITQKVILPKAISGQGRVARRIIAFQQEPSKPAAVISRWRRIEMNQLIYLVGLIVVIMAILSFFGLR
ncbi:hypothetical protein [Bradyrhizobium sp. URHD0069]|uniref:hypothetical protein n=1 Tax=Bradyrhizobium sp. URHD0069 TaxID=1380355 RepID=UPI000496F234|nr:hypothetical protein [Bradyrhizobium sp. URHD0069]